jgi:hypothetical protein
MNPVLRDEVLGIAEYESIRGPFRARVIEEKKRRRVSIGPRVTAVFENHDSVLLQVQEMLRTERITREAAILHEIQTYNELIPGPGELSVTLMIEIPDATEREAFLVSAAGIEARVWLKIGDVKVPALFDPARVLPDRASAVLYLKFRLPEAGARAIREGRESLSLEIDHPSYQSAAVLSKAVMASLAEDLA